ncbi:MAG: peptidylprolyl isomerase [Acidobacteria bacterium]|nr:peptidylprolyl isomerase [Acidobacteriota bacterium]
MRVHRLCCGFAALLALAAAGCRKSPPDNVAAVVNNRAITHDDLEKAYRRAQLASATERAADDEVVSQKLEVLRSLIDNEIMVQRAEQLGVMAVDSDVEAELGKFRLTRSPEEFQKWLRARNMRLEDLKAQFRRDLSVERLFNKEITSKIRVTDEDIADYYSANKAEFFRPEPQVRLARILVTPRPDPEVRNLKGDKAQNDREARRKIALLEARIRKGEDFADLAVNYSEDPESAQNGGDLGFLLESSLEKTAIEIRQGLKSVRPGRVSPVIRTAEGYQLIKVISREPAGQRELDDPRVRQTIRETLVNRRDRLLRAAYYEVARNSAKVVNYLAQSILAGGSR